MADARDPRIRIWNVLHDGEITAIEGEGSASLKMFVSIPCLRRRVAPLGDSFVLTLSGVTRFVFHHFDGTASGLAAVLDDACTPEIIATKSEAPPIRVDTTAGVLELDFQALRLDLDTGGPMSLTDVDRLANEYWTEWQAKADAAWRRKENRG